MTMLLLRPNLYLGPFNRLGPSRERFSSPPRTSTDPYLYFFFFMNIYVHPLVLGRLVGDYRSRVSIVGVLICRINQISFFVLNYIFVIFNFHLTLFLQCSLVCIAWIINHVWYNIVCGVAVARPSELVVVGSHIANVAFDQSKIYPLFRRSSHERAFSLLYVLLLCEKVYYILQ